VILICENCDFGYPVSSPWCVHCGTSATLAHQAEVPELACDTECYRDYWLCKFSTRDGQTIDFQLFDGHPLDIEGLRKVISRSRLITFNGNNYDMPLISLALDGATNAYLKQISDDIILRNLNPWDLRINIVHCDHIDLFDVAPGMASLKMYMGKLHAPKLQDLPIDPSDSIGLFDRVRLREYCQNDLDGTWLLRDAMDAQIKLRTEMSLEYDVDLRSKSDAQIAEAAMKRTLDFRPAVPAVKSGSHFYYRPPEWLQFVSLDLVELVRNTHFTIAPAGNVLMPEQLSKLVIKLGISKYRMGIGGLHSTEQRMVNFTDDTYQLSDHDVASYYPSLIIQTGIAPAQIGAAFQTIYQGWYNRRMEAKNAGIKKTANSLKTLLNGTFGKLGSAYSIFYAPSELIQVTLTGQLALLMLIERLELCGVRVISGNTDGIVLKTRKDMLWVRDACIRWWEQTTGFVTEANKYRSMFSRDVNNYIAITESGEVKLKGAFAPPEPGASGWPNPTTQVCVDAVVAYLKDGTPPSKTIRGCLDVRQFVSIRNVKGGGVFDGEYLGKAVRWYYAAGSTGHIAYKTNGNMVAKTEGCRPLMQLPDELPADLNYEWYINEARSMLVDLGVSLT